MSNIQADYIYRGRMCGEWIPCSERLPETTLREDIEPVFPDESIKFELSAPVLGYIHGAGESNMAVVLYEKDFDRPAVWVEDFGGTDVDVIAWMPLPEPYRGDQND